MSMRDMVRRKLANRVKRERELAAAGRCICAGKLPYNLRCPRCGRVRLDSETQVTHVAERKDGGV